MIAQKSFVDSLAPTRFSNISQELLIKYSVEAREKNLKLGKKFEARKKI